MRTTCSLLAILLCSVSILGQEKAFKPGDKITLKVTFSQKLPANSQVSVIYQTNAQPQPTAGCQTIERLEWYNSQSTDNRTYTLAQIVPPTVIAGTYSVKTVHVTNPGSYPGSASPSSEMPTITIKNQTPCPKTSQVPPFKIIAQ
ncbi:MAG TPA: hypothetical protein VJN92_14435 [Candidatus Acidoferrum sp.]|nr:hypothetical protein [Candidatus Acidoferrum sp.]